jgi:hypothetical protein
LEYLEPNPDYERNTDELRCPRCSSLDVVHSHRQGMIDALMYRMGSVPRHCRYCGRRFYVDRAKAEAQAQR